MPLQHYLVSLHSACWKDLHVACMARTVSVLTAVASVAQLGPDLHEFDNIDRTKTV
jgi:hypothetical protein